MKRYFLLTLITLCFAAPAFAQQSMKAGGGEVTISRTGQTTIKSRSDKSVNVESNTAITGTLSTTGATTHAGKVTITADPASTANTNASLVVNPATSATNELLFGALDNGTSRFTVDKEGDTAVAGTFTVTGATAINGAITVGSGNASLTKITKYTATLTPAEVAANTCAEQTFTVTGVTTSDILFVNKPTAQAGLGIAGVRASGADQVGINFCNATGAGITPTAGQVYSFGAIR